MAGRTYKKDYCELDCLNCGERERVCTYSGECENLEPLTHQEYIQTCSTEELAEVISDIARSCYECGKNPMENFCYFGHCLLADMGAEVWLKEKKE